MVGFARSLATKQTYGAKSENEEGEGSRKGRDSRHRKIVESDKVGIIAESYREGVKQLSPAYQKNWLQKTFRAYRACRDVTLPPLGPKRKVLRRPA